MSTINGLGSASSIGGLSGLPGGVSPDCLLAYCQSELSSLDGQMSTLMQAQQQQIKDQQVVNQLAGVFNQFGANGPQNAADFQTCMNAINQAIKGLPPNDATASGLQTLEQQMTKEYGYQPPGGETVTTLALGAKVGTWNNPVGALFGMPVTDFPGVPSGAVCTKVENDHATWNLSYPASLGTQPSSASWSATTDSLKSIGSDANSDAQIGMLQLQDLVSQRQQAVEEASGMMTTEDQTLSDQAKAIGEG